MATFSERLKELRTQKGLSQQELADRTNQTKQAISQYERSVRKPDMEVLAALCDIFNVSMDYLTGKADVTVRFLNADDLKALNKCISSDEYALPPQIQRTAYDIYKAAPVIYDVYESDDRDDLVKHADYLKRRQDYLLPNAAHAEDPTPEQTENADNIMNDPEEWT
jgi:transcriptional regulator with XRE-family HTH domain